MTKLVLRQGGTIVGEFPLIKPVVTIGRKTDNDLRIDNLAVSGHHARVVKAGERYVLEDLGSTNGTFIGSKRVKQHVLTDGMEFTIGKHSVRFVNEVVKAQDDDQATVFLAAQQPAASRGAQGTARVDRSRPPSGRGKKGGGSSMALMVLGIVLVSVAVFVLILWLNGLI
jgi:predicted component of type VI protein secretion system